MINQRPVANHGPGFFEGPTSHRQLCWWSLIWDLQPVKAAHIPGTSVFNSQYCALRGCESGCQPEGLIRDIANLSGCKRFGQVINGSHAGAFYRGFDTRITGNDNDLGGWIEVTHCL